METEQELYNELKFLCIRSGSMSEALDKMLNAESSKNAALVYMKLRRNKWRKVGKNSVVSSYNIRRAAEAITLVAACQRNASTKLLQSSAASPYEFNWADLIKDLSILWPTLKENYISREFQSAMWHCLVKGAIVVRVTEGGRFIFRLKDPTQVAFDEKR